MLEKVKLDLVTKDVEITTHKGKATVYWNAVEDWRECGLKEILPIITKVIAYYDNEDGTTTTREFTENLEADYYNLIPLYPESVEIFIFVDSMEVRKLKVLVKFSGFP